MNLSFFFVTLSSLLLLIQSPSHALLSFTGSLGTTVSGEAAFSYDANAFYHIDGQSWLGIRYSQRDLDSVSLPTLGPSLWVRLPLGSVILPYAVASVNSPLNDEKGWLWDAGGGIDWKNGKYSSILFQGGYEWYRSHRAWYAHVGLLLEF